MNGMVLLRYVGGNVGSMNWHGPVTGTRYEFGGKKVTGYVYAEDAPKMLEMRLRTKLVFQRVTAPPAPVVKPGRLEAALPEPRGVVLPDAVSPVPAEVEDLTAVKGVGQVTADGLVTVGIVTVAALAEIDANDLTDEMPHLALWRAERIVAAAQGMMGG